MTPFIASDSRSWCANPPKVSWSNPRSERPVFLGLRFGLGLPRMTLGDPSDGFLASLRHGRDLTFGTRPFSFFIRRGAPPGRHLAALLSFRHGGVGPRRHTF